jgi:hypothetical protein
MSFLGESGGLLASMGLLIEFKRYMEVDLR